MPPYIDLEPYKGEILDLLSQKTTHEAIRDLLQDRYRISISRSGLKNRLREWQLTVPTNTTNRVDIRARVKELLPLYNTGDILRILTADGTPSSERTIRRIRGDLGIKLRLSPEEREQQLADIEAILISEFIIGDIEDFGRRALHRHLQAMGLYYTEVQIQTVYHLLRPDAIEGRLPGRRRERINYISPGPNDVWHVDGHMKLEPFGIEIYAAIDGYSRYIVWPYVGVSARTAVSVQRQCLDVFAEYGFQPRKIRSDRGTETVLLADTQYELRKLADPSVQIRDCYLYGRSVDNQRIEGWWGLLSRATTGLFHEYFKCLQRENLFVKDCIPEQVSLLAIYMPLIRHRVEAYTNQWNHHRIQSQPHRPHIVKGKPIMNWKHADVPDLHCPVDVNSSLFQSLQQDVQDWDPDEYLPPSTLTWCHQQLAEIGQQLIGIPFDPNDPSPALCGEPRAPYRAVYEALRERAFTHWNTGQDPILDVCIKPHGAADWQGIGAAPANWQVADWQVTADWEGA